MNIVERIKALPTKTQSLLGIGVVVALVVALPLFVWGIINVTFDIRERAASGEPSPIATRPPNTCPYLEACPDPKLPYLLKNCHPPESDNSPQEKLCNQKGKVEFCGTTNYCCPGPQMAWTTNMNDCVNTSPRPTPSIFPTRTPTPRPTPTFTGTPTPTATIFGSITPSPTPIPSRKPLNFKVRFEGVDDESAEGARATIRFVSGWINVVTPQLAFTHTGRGIYEAVISPTGYYLPFWGTGNGYTIYVKGEKHASNKFCNMTGQGGPCVGAGNIPVPETTAMPFSLYDFTGFPLQPGDLPPQDGRADPADFAKIKALLNKPCSELTPSDRATADLDYNGCINIKDAFLMRKTLETRYDEY